MVFLRLSFIAAATFSAPFGDGSGLRPLKLTATRRPSVTDRRSLSRYDSDLRSFEKSLRIGDANGIVSGITMGAGLLRSSSVRGGEKEVEGRLANIQSKWPFSHKPSPARPTDHPTATLRYPTANSTHFTALPITTPRPTDLLKSLSPSRIGLGSTSCRRSRSPLSFGSGVRGRCHTRRYASVPHPRGAQGRARQADRTGTPPSPLW